MDKSNGGNSRRNTRKRRSGATLRKGSIFNDVTVERCLDFKSSHETSFESNLNPLNQSSGSTNDSKDNVAGIKNENNKVNKDDDEPIGEGYYVSAIMGTRRYYGILVDQATFSQVSTFHIQDEMHSLELNNRMQRLLEKQNNENDTSSSEKKRSSDDSASSDLPGKRPKLSSSPHTASTEKSDASFLRHGPSNDSPDNRSVQKFKYTKSNDQEQGHRYLLATYANTDAASEDDPELSSKIKTACQSGGDWIGAYYYQYEVSSNSLRATSNDMKYDDVDATDNDALRKSVSFPTFLQRALLPSWYPLCNTNCIDTNKALKMFQMKPIASAHIEKKVIDVDEDKNTKMQTTTPVTPTPAPSSITAQNPTAEPDTSSMKSHSNPIASVNKKSSLMNLSQPIKMKVRTAFRVGIVGGGLAGLSTALELLRMAEPANENIDIEVTIFEAQDCVGGRLKTDSSTFQMTNKERGTNAPFPVDLGAGWIHGISRNPLADLAKEAGVQCVSASEEVKMLAGGMKAVDVNDDTRVGELFNTLLDRAAKKCWKKDEYNFSNRNQMATRWYAEHVHLSKNKDRTVPRKTDVPAHRYSSDSNIDTFLGKALEEWYAKTPEKLTPVEQNLLLWNTKNAEYALGANISDLSMKYWDADEAHAFGGDHVVLKGGFATLADHLLKKCKKYGKQFKVILNSPVSRIYYGLDSSSCPYPKSRSRKGNTLLLSNTCGVACENRDDELFDFVVCALPLGVLKRDVYKQKHKQKQTGVRFCPPLPKTKQDAIDNVGFGLLNKVYMQFPTTFWRKDGSVESLSKTPFLAKSQYSFGNVSGLNPHHYMFFDVGRCVNGLNAEDEPAILLTLISGSAAVEAEQMPDASLVDEIMSTLRYLFSDIRIPSPTSYKVTKWGSNPYSCGSYTFLPPGTSDQDYQILQSPINKSGELISGTGKGNMRLFWAGEHTSYLFPSMAHGAFHSGTCAARDVFANINVRKDDDKIGIDRQIPVSVYRERYPTHPIQCSLCSLPGRMEEGAILAFQRGTKDALVHSRCAEYSPEVDMRYGVWKHVIKAVIRGKKLKCVGCGRAGATIGCQDSRCKENYHFRCCKGWDFVKLGKEFRCALHRPRKKEEKVASCFLCRNNEESTGTQLGRLIGFEKGNTSIMVHSNCIKYTNIVDIEESDSNDKKVTKVFESISLSKKCSTCYARGATIKCFVHYCTQHIHFSCLDKSRWDFRTKGSVFFCPLHRIQIPGQLFICSPKPTVTYAQEPSKINASIRSLQNSKMLDNSSPTSALKVTNGDHGNNENPSFYFSDNNDIYETESIFDASESGHNTESEDEIEILNLTGTTSSMLKMISGETNQIESSHPLS